MAALTGNIAFRNGGETGEVGFGRLISKLVNYNGVIVSGDLAVTAQGTPNNTVAVAPGDCVIGALAPSVSTYSYHGFLAATGNLTVTANASGSPRIDSVVAYVDLSVVSAATSENPGAFKVNVVAGTPAGSPTAPSSVAIATAIGASNPYIVLANIAVANGFSSIVSGNITDTRTVAGINKRVYQLSGSGSGSLPAASSSAWTDLTGANLSLTTAFQSTVWVSVNAAFQNNSTVSNVDLRAVHNGTNISTTGFQYVPVSGAAYPVKALVVLTGVPAGTATVNLQFRSASTSTQTSTNSGGCSFEILSIQREA